MAVKNHGGTVDAWDSWSKSDSRYRANDCGKKWKSFGRDGVGVGSVVEICKKHGGTPPAIETEHRELKWDDTISNDGIGSENKIIRKEWLHEDRVPEAPKDWNGMDDLKTYLKTLFEPDDYVGIVTKTFASDPDNEGNRKQLPDRGAYAFQVKQYLKDLNKGKEIEDAIGDYTKEVGAWIRFNPLDGQGVYDKNVTDLRYALVESDDLSIDKQYAIYKELELPIIALVTSGNKSLHAIVKIHADNYKEYQQRVDFLYQVCKENGLSIDRQNRNPSRLSRLPGVERNGNKQRLIDTSIGKESWSSWKDWIAEQNDDMPEFEDLDDLLKDPPPLADEQVHGILRHGHKMMVAGPSKAGKSLALIQLAIAIREGKEWMGWQCEQGDVLYVNLELDGASFINRYKDVYEELKIERTRKNKITIWNLRGKSKTLDKMTPRLIRRAAKGNYSAIIIDPIYKVITGDENSAEQMSKFLNHFDKICTELNTSIIYCHHHSKGSQGSKNSMDRSSGSGVLLRDPDASLDFIELLISETQREQMINQWICEAVCLDMDIKSKNWRDSIMPDYTTVSKKLLEHIQVNYKHEKLENIIQEATKKAEQASGWRIEGTLREFPNFPPKNCYFKYPIHQIDDTEFLKDCLADGEEPSREKKVAIADNIRQNKNDECIVAWEMISERGMGNNVTVADMMKELNIGNTAVRTRLKNAGCFDVKKSLVIKQEG